MPFISVLERNISKLKDKCILQFTTQDYMEVYLIDSQVAWAHVVRSWTLTGGFVYLPLTSSPFLLYNIINEKVIMYYGRKIFLITRTYSFHTSWYACIKFFSYKVLNHQTQCKKMAMNIDAYDLSTDMLKCNAVLPFNVLFLSSLQSRRRQKTASFSKTVARGASPLKHI